MTEAEPYSANEEDTVGSNVFKYVRTFFISFPLVFLGVAGGMFALQKYAGIRVIPPGRVVEQRAEREVQGKDDLAPGVERSDSLGTREEEEAKLAAWERRLTRREKDIAAKEQVVEALMARLTAEKDSIETKRISRLAKIYEAMRPEEAAPIIEALDEATAIRILTKMKQRQAGKILGKLTIERSAEFSRKMTRLD